MKITITLQDTTTGLLLDMKSEPSEVTDRPEDSLAVARAAIFYIDLWKAAKVGAIRVWAPAGFKRIREYLFNHGNHTPA